MDRFDEIMETVLKLEGGFVDNDYDDGGPTNLGITHTVLAEWRGVSDVSRDEVKNLTKAEAIDIFRDRYWKKVSGPSLPQPVDLIVMDGAVNHGVVVMSKFLQVRLGVNDDGRIGKATLEALAARTSKKAAVYDLAVELADDRKARYTNHHDAKHFLPGWRNRLNHVMSVALKGAPVSWNFKDGKGGATTGSPPATEEEMPPTTIIRPVIEDIDLQAMLASLGLYKGDLDGMFGPKSAAALDQFLTVKTTAVSGDWRKWPLQRKKIAAGQLLCNDLDINAGRIDGLVGPMTIEAFENFNRMKLGLPLDAWRDQIDALPGPPDVPGPVANTWPREKDVPAFYGQLGKGCTLVPLKRLELPYEMKLSWKLNKKITGFTVHEKVHDSAARVFDKFYAYYGDAGIEDLGLDLFGGVYRCANKKGGSTWSMHAWSIAIDFDPARNDLKWSHTRARLAKPDAVRFWEFWEEEGWVSLGRTRDFDWMHVQAARL